MNIKNVSLQPRTLVAELVGTFILTTVAITVANPIIVGFVLVVLVLSLGSVSGAHLNPAITFGLWAVKRVETVKALFFWSMQFLGAVLALLVTQMYQGTHYGISFASFGQFDTKIVVAELLGTAVFAFAVVAALHRQATESARALCIGLGLLTGLAVGGGLLGVAAQNISTTSATQVAPRVSKVDGAILNPAIALASTEKDDSQSASLQSLGSTASSPSTKRPASRFSLETIVGSLVGAAIGTNLYMAVVGENPFSKKKPSIATTVTKVFKKGKK